MAIMLLQCSMSALLCFCSAVFRDVILVAMTLGAAICWRRDFVHVVIVGAAPVGSKMLLWRS